MNFDHELLPGVLLRRYKRFLADVELEDGSTVTVHCPNTGSMRGCLGDRWPVLLSQSGNPKRKYPLTWEMVHNGRCWIGINTHLANILAVEAIEGGAIPELCGYDSLRREVSYGSSSRIDILLEGTDNPCWVEVKNVTLVDDQGRYAFPDAVTERGRKHLRELQQMVLRGDRAVMLFIIQRSDGSTFAPAADIDPAYAEELRRAASNGVEVFAYRTDYQSGAINVADRVDVSEI